MKIRAISGIMLTLLLIGMLTLAFNIKPVKPSPGTIIVPDDYEKIQWAIGNASDGDTIFVRADTYYENIRVNKTVSIIGEDSKATIIDGNNTGVAVEITADDVQIKGFTLRNSHGIIPLPPIPSLSGFALSLCSSSSQESDVFLSKGYCVWIHNCGNTLISDNIIWNNTAGVWVQTNINTTIKNNVITKNLIGICLWMCIQGNNIIGNNITQNRLYGVLLIRPVMIPIKQNVFYHNNFINNANQTYIHDSFNSTWNDVYPSGGNYWSDYNGTDLYSGLYQNVTGSDGIGDTSYIINENNQDKYPLMEPWSPPTMIKTLIRTVKFWNIHRGTKNSLTSKLEGALRLLDLEKENRAINKLMAFINQVEAKREKKLTNEQADYLIATAQEIIDLIKV